MIRGTFVFLAAAALGVPVQAGDGVFGKGLKIYPKSEAHYIKQFSGPTISPCGPCFGYNRTQWRSWGEACNEPQPVDPGPVKYAPPAEEAIPEPEKKGTPATPKIETGPKATEKKDPPVIAPEKKEPPKVDAPKPPDVKPEVPKIELPKPPEAKPGLEPKTENTSIVLPLPSVPTPLPVPPAPAPLPVPAVVPLPLPTVIVPISSK
ncbi:hypothetical protein [Limnoglobus roseus]|uniref:Filamentous hemagglutinin n=1 Tax=Limnoglobus roseus TaxID=2598579 RepID=A0A5C1AG58_9BACT|nr:hypothetical protein [Limnoglobus roseus]QEL17223.1 hypothetical protein PX52LOC_04206 [Limnoglobus roseus]